jgi:hypothetical protein
MIRFSGSSNRGRAIIGIGISEGNVQRLKEGKPIHIHADDMGFAGEIVIFYGETEDLLAKQLRETMEIGEFRDQRDEKKN